MALFSVLSFAEMIQPEKVEEISRINSHGYTEAYKTVGSGRTARTNAFQMDRLS